MLLPSWRTLSAAVAVALVSGSTFVNRASAQLELIPDTAPDRSLGTQVGPSNFPTINFVSGGTRPQNGQNVFHSFQEFNIRANRGVYFESLPGVRNILTRVTGSDPSDILGTLGVAGTANLFFINPNGILFGRNASLDLGGGSFYGTTASGIKFGEVGEFSAVNPQPPSNLLTINPSAFFFTAQPPGAIVNQSRAIRTVLGNSTNGLQVRNGRTLMLLGGNVALDGGQLNAWSGRIEIGAIAGSGSVEVNANGSLSLPNGVQRADVTLTDRAFVDVAFDIDGDIGITANNISLSNRSLLSAGIFSGLEDTTSQAGDITLNATGTVQLTGNSALQNAIFPGASGNGGNIHINTGSLIVTNLGAIQAVTAGRGNAGNIRIQAQDRVLVTGGNQAGTVRSTILNQVLSDGQGNGGDIEITAKSLEVVNRAALSAATLGQGNAGDVLIRTSDQVLFVDSVAFSSVGGNGGFTGFGNGGNIDVITPRLILLDGGQLDASTFSQGNSGNITVKAGTVLLDGTSSDGRRPSTLFTEVVAGATGNGGEIRIETESLAVTNGGKLEASTRGIGNAGNILVIAERVLFDGRGPANSSGAFTPVKPGAVGNGGSIQIESNSISVSKGAQIGAGTEGNGNGGNISLTARDFILFANRGVALSAVAPEADGNGGNISINTGSLILDSGGQLSNTTAGTGDAGDIIINAQNSVLVNGSDPSDSDLISIVATNVGRRATGNGGDINITTGSLLIRDQGTLVTDTQGQGDAGNIAVKAQDQVVINNGTVSSIVARGGFGDGGDIAIATTTLALVNDGVLSASTFSQGAAGNIQIDASDLVNLNSSGIFVRSNSFDNAGNITVASPNIRLNQGIISAESAAVDGGNINLNVGRLLLLRNGSLISATAGTAQAGGNGGNITINAPKGFIVGVKSEDSDIAANAFSGSGGRVNITAQGIFGLEFRPQLTEFSDITASSTFGQSGIVTLNIPNVDPSRGLAQLPQNLIDTNRILANSCIVRDTGAGGAFYITGSGGLPVRPGDAVFPTFATGDVRGIGAATSNGGFQPKKDAAVTQPPLRSMAQPAPNPSSTPIAEAQEIYQLPDGQIILSWDCTQ